MDVIQAVAFCAWWLVIIPATVILCLWLLEGGPARMYRRHHHRHR